MSRTIRIASTAIAIVLTAAIVGVVAYDRGRAAPQQGRLEYGPVVASGGVRVQVPPVVRLGPRAGCNWPAWRAITIRSDAR